MDEDTEDQGLSRGHLAAGVPMLFSELVGVRVRAFREAAEMTQETLGKRMGTVLPKPWPKQMIYMTERGRREPNASELVALAAALEVPVTHLLQAGHSKQRVYVGARPFTGRELLRIVAGEGAEPQVEAIGRLRDLITLMTDEVEALSRVAPEDGLPAT